MAVEIYANQPSTTVAAAQTATSGTQSWTVSSPVSFPAASSGASPPTQFHIADPAAPSELIAVTNVAGSVFTVTRGAEGTTPVAHSAGFTIVQVVTAGALGNLVVFGGYLGNTSSSAGLSTHLSACRSLRAARALPRHRPGRR